MNDETAWRHAAQQRRASLAWLSVPVMIMLQLPVAGWLVPGERFSAQLEREVIYWMLTAILLMYITVVERRPLSSVNLLRPTWKGLILGIAGGLVMVAGLALLYAKVLPVFGPTTSESQLETVRALPLWFRLEIVVRAAVLEELFYRGFIIERLTELTRLRWFAAAISIAAFAQAHVSYWGWAHLLVASFAGCILTLLYLWRRDLSCNMIAHAVTDAIGILAG